MATLDWDVVIVGAGPAGLSAALVLGRACRKVLVCDKGTPRNWASKAIYGFLTRDGVDPAEFRRLAHSELAKYPQVTVRTVEVEGATRASVSDGFEVTFRGVPAVSTRKLLLATGVLDHLPPLEGIEPFFGSSVFQCPYCDGWEVHGLPTAVYGKRRRGFEMARALTGWTDDIVLCTDGAPGLSRSEKTELQRNGIRVLADRIECLAGEGGQLEAVVFKDGSTLRRSTLFFDTPSSEQSMLAQTLGCRFSEHGGIKCGQYEATSVPGVFAAGNIIRDVQLAIVAAAEGAKAAFGINRALTREDFSRRTVDVQAATSTRISSNAE